MSKTTDRMWTTEEAGAILGVNDSRIRQLAGAGRLPGSVCHGDRYWQISAAAVAAFERDKRGRKPGRRKKAS